MQEDVRGRSAEQTFFDDPALDALMGVVMALAMDHYVLRDQVRALQEQLVRAGQLESSALTAAPPASAQEDAHRDAAAFVEDLLFPILGVQQASGAAGRFSLKRKT